MNYLVAYLIVLVAYLVLDYLWLRGMMQRRLRREASDAFRDAPRLGPTVGFAVCYAVVLTGFAVASGSFGSEQGWAEGWRLVVLLSAILGLVAHGARGFGNLALIRGWRWSTALLDLAWGAVVSAIAALAGYGAASAWV